MGILSVLIAAVGGFAIGAVWYGVLSKAWVEASGVPTNEEGKPQNEKSPAPYITSIICIIIVSGMMRHMFAMAGIDGAIKGLVAGLGVGLFFIAPWITLNCGYAMRPKKLAIIDGGYAVLACSVIGLILGLF